MTGKGDCNIAGLLLAAGGSNRLGRPKQLVRVDGQTLIRRSAQCLIDAGADPIVVVLGAEVDSCTSEIADMPVTVIINENWREGMSTSIRSGIDAVRQFGNSLDGVLICLCDQLHVTSSELRSLITTARNTPGKIVAAEYAGTVGVPAVFPYSYFSALQNITGDRGAREIIRNEMESVVAIPIQGAQYDLDTSCDIPPHAI
jgi:molybdenum cofactor cytidylyltransferase